MARYDFSTRRLFIDAPLVAGARVGLNREQSNYLLNVLRLEAGAGMLVFNGRDGEWRARLALAGKRDVALEIEKLERAQTPPSDLRLLFAPLKHARLDYMIQKAVEMGAGTLTPTLTRRTQVRQQQAHGPLPRQHCGAHYEAGGGCHAAHQHALQQKLQGGG